MNTKTNKDEEGKRLQQSVGAGKLVSAMYFLCPHLDVYITKRIPQKFLKQPKQKDFAYYIKTITSAKAEVPECLVKIARRCTTIRNQVSHQARMEEYEILRCGDTLRKLAKQIGCEDTVLSTLNTIVDSSPYTNKDDKSDRKGKMPQANPVDSNPNCMPLKSVKKKVKVDQGGKSCTSEVVASSSSSNCQQLSKSARRKAKRREEKKKVVRTYPDPEENVHEIKSPTLKEGSWLMFKDMGNRQYKEGNYLAAMLSYTKALTFDSQQAVLYSNRALCELQLKKYELAREDAEDAIALDSNNIKYHRTLSTALYHLELWDECLTVCENGLKYCARDEVLLKRQRDCIALEKGEWCTDAKRSLKRGNGGRTSAHFAANNDLPDDFEEASRILQTEEHRNKMFEYFSSLQADESDIESSPTAVLASFKVLGTVTKAHQYRRRGDIQQAAAFYEKAAKRGSAEGMYNLAIYISEGCGGRDRDFSLAMDYIKQAVRQKAFLRVPGNSLLPNIGVAEAENFMGNSYREGRGVDICFETAFQWHLKSAVHGCLQGMNNVGVALQNGHGCQKNHKEARCWYKQAAEGGCSDALFNYGSVLCDGLGGPVDNDLAKEMLTKAKEAGCTQAIGKLRALNIKVPSFPSSSSSSSSISPSSSSSSSLPSSSSSRYSFSFPSKQKAWTAEVDAYVMLQKAQNFHLGEGGMEVDYKSAEELYEKAAMNGAVSGFTGLAVVRLDHLKDAEGGVRALRSAISAGLDYGVHYNDAVPAYLKSYFLLSECLAYGHGCEHNAVEARRVYSRMLRSGYSNQDDDSKKIKNDFFENNVRLGEMLQNFEKENSFLYEGMSLKERRDRFMKATFSPDHVKHSDGKVREGLSQAVLSFLKSCEATPTPFHPSQIYSRDSWNEIMQRAEKGRRGAQMFVMAHLITGKVCLSFEEKGSALSAGDADYGLAQLRYSFQLYDLQVVDEGRIHLLHSVANKRLREPKNLIYEQRNGKHADASLLLLHFEFPRRTNRERLDHLVYLVELHGSDADLNYSLGSAYGFMNQWDRCVHYIQRAIDLNSSQPSWLYDLATGYRNTLKVDETIQTLLKFKEETPIDHRKRPEAEYCLALQYLMKKDIDNVKKHWKLGLAAEDPSIRLPLVPPVGGFPVKTTLQMLAHLNFEGAEVYADAFETVPDCDVANTNGITFPF